MFLQIDLSSFIPNVENLPQNTDFSDINLLELTLKAIKQKDSMTIKILIVIGIIYFFLLLLTSLIIPIILNQNNRKNEVLKIKIEKKLEFIDNLLKNIRVINSSLSILDDENIKKTQKNIKVLRNEMYYYTFKIPHKMASLIYEFLDYFDKVLINSYARDTEKEKDLYEKICKEYELLK